MHTMHVVLLIIYGACWSINVFKNTHTHTQTHTHKHTHTHTQTHTNTHTHTHKNTHTHTQTHMQTTQTHTHIHTYTHTHTLLTDIFFDWSNKISTYLIQKIVFHIFDLDISVVYFPTEYKYCTHKQILDQRRIKILLKNCKVWQSVRMKPTWFWDT